MIIALTTFLAFLFVFHTLAKEDFVFLRKNITLEQLFNTIFLGLPFVLLFARLFYIAFHFKLTYLNPLVFFVIPYFPGLSAGGGIIGAILWIYFFTKNKKIASLRFADEVSLAFLLSSGIYFLLLAIQQSIQHHTVASVLMPGIIALFYFTGFSLVRRLLLKEQWQDGAIAACSIILKSLFSLLTAVFLIALTRKLVFHPEDIFSVILLLLGVGFFIFFQTSAKKG